MCPECGQTPMGSACYHICPNSNHFYSPEQERQDDALYGYDHWEGWGDPDLYPDNDDEASAIVPDTVFTISPSAPDDIPF